MSIPPATAFVQSLTADLVARAAADERLAPFVEALRAVDCEAPRFERAEERFEHPTMRYLEPTLSKACGTDAVVAAAREVSKAARWYQIFNGGGIETALAEGLLAAQVVGTIGMVADEVVRCGAFLLAPGIHYPAHTHAASEIYYCLSGTLELAYGLGEGSFELRPGALSVTPPHRLHSLTTHDSAVLLIYVWIGQVDEPNWWWEKREDGAWQRNKWMRAPDASWQLADREDVTEDVMRAALGQ